MDDELIEELDENQSFEGEEDDDFKTMKESEIDENEQMMFGDG